MFDRRIKHAATLAALQLASAKRGSIIVTGDDDSKQRCTRLAAGHGFDLVNPELQDAIRGHRDKFEKQQRFEREWSEKAADRSEQSQEPRPRPMSPTPDWGSYSILNGWTSLPSVPGSACYERLR